MVLLRAISLLAVALTGFLTSAPRATSRTYSSVDLHVLRVASAGLAHGGVNHMLHWLRHQPVVRSVGWVPASHTLDMRFRDGFAAAVLSRRSGTVAVPSRTLFRSLSRNYAPNAGQALVLEPFATQLGLGSQTNDVEASELRTAGFHVDELYNTAVTVASMANFARYNVVYIHTHSGVAPGGEGLVATGQVVNHDPALQPLIANESVIVVGVSGSSALYYAIASGYIRTQVGQFPANSLFFANGCNLLDAPLFWQALQSRGMGALVSWNLEATSKDNYFAGAAFFNDMGQGMTIDQAIKTEQSAGLGISVSQGVTARLGYLGDGTITLQRAASSPAGSAPPTATSVPATTAPTATPTGVPPTPLPTATPIILNATATATSRTVPPPPPPGTPPPHAGLSAVLKPIVVPGSRQVIQVTFTPATIIHFRVTYPNGDHQSARRTTGPRGIAIYAYKQGSSKITRTNMVAGVTIEAGSGAGHTSILESYRLGFGPIDLSVQPRSAITGDIVHVWVHTQPRTRVMLTLLVANQRAARFWTKTGPGGWAHPGRRINGTLASTGGKVVVVGRASFAGQSVVSRTFFSVR